MLCLFFSFIVCFFVRCLLLYNMPCLFVESLVFICRLSGVHLLSLCSVYLSTPWCFFLLYAVFFVDPMACLFETLCWVNLSTLWWSADTDDSRDWTLNHGRSIALSTALKDATERILTSDVETQRAKQALVGFIAADRVQTFTYLLTARSVMEVPCTHESRTIVTVCFDFKLMR